MLSERPETECVHPSSWVKEAFGNPQCIHGDICLKPYDELTKLGQIRRLRRLAENAVEQFGIRDYKLRFIKHLINTTFVLTCDRGRFLLRIHRGRSTTVHQIKGELAWLDALSHHTDVTVQTPLRTPDGRMVVFGDLPDTPAFPVTILKWITGRIIQYDRKERDFRHLGQLIGKLHSHATRWPMASQLDRWTYDAEGIFGSQAAYPLDQVSPDVVPEEARVGLERAYKLVRETEAQLPRTDDLFGLIHVDLSFSNILLTAREAKPIDFDDCGYGYFLAVVLAGGFGEPNFQSKYETVVGGYREYHPLPSELLVHLPAFLTQRSSSYLLVAAVRYRSFARGVWRSRLKLALEPDLFPVQWEV